MMLDYLLRLLLLLPLVGGMAWGALWLWKRLQAGLPAAAGKDRLVQLVEVLPMATGSKLAVVEFAGRLHLLSVTRAGIQMLASDDRGDFHA